MKIVSLVSQMKWEPHQLEKLNNLGEFKEYSRSKAKSDEIIELIGDAEVLIVGASGVERIDSNVLTNCPELKFITVLGAGADFVDIEKATERNIKISNLKGANAQSVAEHVWGMILGLSKRITEAHIGTKKGRYQFFDYLGKEIQGKTLGIIGFGSIGSRVAKIAKAFDMKVLAFNRTPKQSEGVEFVKMQYLLENSDVVVVAITATSETKGLISQNEISKMKNGTILVSISRESVVEEASVLEALENNKLFGFGMELDIKQPANPQFYNYENVVITPHTAFFTTEAELKCNDMAVENVEMFLKGTPQNLIN